MIVIAGRRGRWLKLVGEPGYMLLSSNGATLLRKASARSAAALTPRACGGGQAGLAAVTDVWVKLHRRRDFGCLFKVELVYQATPADPSWIMLLASVEPRSLHTKVRWQNSVDGHFKFKLALTMLAGPQLRTRHSIAQHLADLLESVGAPLPLGHNCNSSWYRCLRGSRERPGGRVNCGRSGGADLGIRWGPEWEDSMPQTAGEDGDYGWGITPKWHKIFLEKSEQSASIYSASYRHRTSVKSMLLRELNPAFFQAADSHIRELNSVYISACWWGNGTWGEDSGALADVTRPYAWMVIISADFLEPRDDAQALNWTTATVDALVRASGESFLPYPNLYDRTSVTNSSHGPVLHRERAPSVTFRERAGDLVRAKRKWDPESLFGMRFGTSGPKFHRCTVVKMPMVLDNVSNRELRARSEVLRDFKGSVKQALLCALTDSAGFRTSIQEIHLRLVNTSGLVAIVRGNDESQQLWNFTDLEPLRKDLERRINSLQGIEGMGAVIAGPVNISHLSLTHLSCGEHWRDEHDAGFGDQALYDAAGARAVDTEVGAAGFPRRTLKLFSFLCLGGCLCYLLALARKSQRRRGTSAPLSDIQPPELQALMRSCP